MQVINFVYMAMTFATNAKLVQVSEHVLAKFLACLQRVESADALSIVQLDLMDAGMLVGT